MKRIIIGIFAHPDDETFGMSPTIIHELHTGAEVHLLSLTSGQNGTNPDNVDDLGAVRTAEWYEAARIMGVEHLKVYDYVDGTLCNADIDTIVPNIIEYVTPLIASGVEVEFLTIDFTGITGHIDHIVAAHSASLAYYRLKEAYPDTITRIRYRCIPRSRFETTDYSWRLMLPGCPDDQIDETVDVPEYYDQVVSAIRAHVSQRNDGETHISHQGRDICKNFYRVVS